MRLADVIIHRDTNQLNKAWVYRVPEELGDVPIGSRVYVPIGHSHDEGLIIGYRTVTPAQWEQIGERYFLIDFEGKKRVQLKAITRVLDVDPWFTPEMLATAHALAAYYLCPLGLALRLFTINKNVQKGYARPTDIYFSFKGPIPDTGRKKRLYDLLAFLVESKGPVSTKVLIKHGFSAEHRRQALAIAGVVTEERYRDTMTQYDTIDCQKNIPLTEAQQECFSVIANSITKKHQQTHLLHGVTGSGKTQVYLKAVQHCLAQGRSAIVLVPEISLTYQIVRRFVEIFGDEVVVFHSQMTINERYNSWERLRRGESHIIIGARSAVFAPLENIGLIILDEEHDTAYKDWDHSKYHARKVAQLRATYHHCPVVLGSATPSVESYYLAKSGIYNLLTLPDRIFQQPLPPVSIIDMKEELFFGNRSVFSDAMRNLIHKTLNAKEQMILLMNRRGYSTFILCRSCGEAIKCPHCDTSLIYHRANEQLRCHYCEFKEAVPQVCPKCGSNKIKFFGSGTQKVEETLRRDYPQARIARVDQDQKTEKGSLDRIFTDFGLGKYDILLGTQMVSKGHDFPGVTAVGVVTADSALHIPEYTAAERAFSLLTQTAGRAGRGEQPGKVVIQTYDPTHYAIIHSKDHNYLGFYNEEIQLREAMFYPPFSQLVRLTIGHTSPSRAQHMANRIRDDLYHHFHDGNIQIFGPYQETLYRKQDIYRQSITLKGIDLSAIKSYIYNSWIFQTDGLSITVDPL